MANIFETLLKGVLGEKRRRSASNQSQNPTPDDHVRRSHASKRPKVPIPGCGTQYPDSNGKSGKLQLVIGLDFGTAFTKVVIGEQRQAYAVPFDCNSTKGGSPYLLPGVISVSPNGRVKLGKTPRARAHADLKMRILSGNEDMESLVQSASFIALVMQHARAWFLNTHFEIYKNYSLDWFVNVGLPTSHYHDDNLTTLYRRIVSAAWLASTRSTPLDIGMVRKCFDDHTDSIANHAIGLFPEFAAQVNGYVRTPLRMPDLHLLIDVGAGTVDVAVFNVHQRDGENVFPIFAKSVQNLGVYFLHQHRLTNAGISSGIDDFMFRDGTRDATLAKSLGMDIGKLRTVDKPFRQKIFDQIQSDVAAAKRKYPLSRHWHTGVPFFFCGGGANVELYANFADAMVKDGVPCKLVRITLPTPERLVAPELADWSYDRLSVAYGLSFDQFDIGEIERSDQIEDLDGAGKETNQRTQNATCTRCCGTGGLHSACDRCGGTGWS